MKKYKKRIVDELLLHKLEGFGAVLIEGPKWCGKTTTARQQAGSVLDLGNSKTLEDSLLMISIDTQRLLDGSVPKLIDEWQTIPRLWDAVRNEVDNRAEPGQFILTGSSVPPDVDAIHHSGTGRFARLKMRPMSLFESEESDGSVRLSDLFNGKGIPSPLDASDQLKPIAFQCCRGGWPYATFLKENAALDQAYEYFNSVCESDVSRIDKTKRSPERTRQIMRSYARNQGMQIPFSSICSDIKANDKLSISDDTVADYVEALRKLFVIEDMPAWNPNLRSKTAIRTSDTRYFVDPSIAAAALGIGPDDLMNDLKAFGMFFESMAVRDLRIYASKLGGNVYHYRDSNGLECDTVIHLRNGKYGLVEIKLGGTEKIEEGAKNIQKLASIIDTTKMQAPSFLMVLTAVSKYAYRRQDGVFVVPISSLRD